MSKRRFLMIFAVGVLLGAVLISIFRGEPTDSLPDTPKDLEQPESAPTPIAPEPGALRPAEPKPAAPESDPPKPAEVTRSRPPDRLTGVKPWLEEVQERHSFNDERLEAEGCFSSDDIAWIRLRWEEFEEDKQALADRAALGELSSDGAEWAELQRTLRENLGEERYDGMLFATEQTNGVKLSSLPRGSRAADAGLRSGDRVLSYNGVRVYNPKALVELVGGEFFDHLVEIEVRRSNGTIETVPIEPGPLGARLFEWQVSPCPEADQDRDRGRHRPRRGGGKRYRAEPELEEELEPESDGG